MTSPGQHSMASQYLPFLNNQLLESAWPELKLSRKEYREDFRLQMADYGVSSPPEELKRNRMLLALQDMVGSSLTVTRKLPGGENALTCFKSVGRKKLNRHAKSLAGLQPLLMLLPLSGCASRPDYTLSPSTSSEWVTVAVKLPAETEVLPLDVLYRSETCRRKVDDPTTESHVSTERGLNPMQMDLSPADGNGVRQIRIALEGGTKCGWTLSGIRVGIQLAKTSVLANGKNITPANYVFDFDYEGYSSAFGKGEPNSVSDELIFKTEFFPMIYVNHAFDETDIDIFSGDEKYAKWNRYYRVSSTRNITLEPILYLNKVVKLESPTPHQERLELHIQMGVRKK